MKKISSKKSLTRKVLCSIMAAGMIGVAGTAFAATEKYPNEGCIAGSYIIDSGAADQNIPTGTYDKGIYIFGPAGVNVIGTGITVKANEVEDTDALTFAAPNSSVTLYNSTITGGVVLRPNNIIATISGGTIKPVFHENGNASEIEVTSGQLTLDKVTINCGMVATNFADEVVVNGKEELRPIATRPVILVDGGTINSVESYDVDAKETAYTEIAAEGTGKVILKGVAINSGIGAYGRHELEPGSVQVENSVINAGSSTAGAEIFAESNGFIHIYNDAKKETHKVSLDVLALDGGKIVVDNANIVVTGMQKVNKDKVDITETNGTIAALAASSIIVNKGDITAYSNIIASNYVTNEKDDLVPSSRKGGLIQVTDGNIIAPNAILVDGCKVVDGEIEGRSTVITKNGNISAGNLISAANGGKVVAENGNITTDTINVTGGGRVVISGSTNVNLKANKILVKDSGSRVVLNQNATLASNNLNELLKGSKNDAIALEGGTISTLSGQIFENALLDDEKKVSEVKDVGSVINKQISFVSGKLVLNDNFYTMPYLKSANEIINEPANTNVIVSCNGKVVGDIQLSDIVNENNNIEIKEDPVNVPANNFVIGDKENKTEGEDTQTTKNNVSVESLILKATDSEDPNRISVINGANLTIGGSENNDNLIAVKDGEKIVDKTVSVEISSGGALVIGNSNAKTDTEYGLNANVNASEGSIEVNAKTKVNGKVNAENTNIKVNNGALHANEMALKNANVHSGLNNVVVEGAIEAEGTNNVTGNIKAKELKVVKDSVLNVGDNDNAGVASFENVELNGSMLFLDPAFKDGSTIKDASQLAVANVDKGLDGHYVVGQNSVMTFGGSDNSKAVDIFNKAAEANKMAWGKDGITAGAYLAKAINVKNGSLVVDGSLVEAPEAEENGTVKFAANSILMVESAIANGEAITGAKKVTVDEKSKLLIAGEIVEGSVYKVFDEGVDANWIKDNVISDNAAYEFVNAEDGGYKAVATKFDDEAANVVMAALKDSKANQVAKDLNASLLGASKAEKEKVLGNIARASAYSGVASSAIVAGAEVATAIGDHLSVGAIAEVGGKGVGLNKENGSAVWAKLVHKKADVDGLKVDGIGKADYDVKQNGIVAGLDIVNTEEKAFGVAITYMDGKVTGAAAKNDTENYGLSVYGKKKVGKAAIIADLSYIHGENDIKSNLVTAKSKSDTLSLGVKAETAIKAGAGQFVPYVGARVTRLGIGDYKDSLGIKHDSDVENLFNIPVGIKYSANIQKGNWTMRPTVDLGYVFNVGNKDGQETVSYGGTSNTFSYEMVDKSSFVGALGFEVENKNVAYNLGYQYTKSDNTKAHKYMLGFKVKF